VGYLRGSGEYGIQIYDIRASGKAGCAVSSNNKNYSAVGNKGCNLSNIIGFTQFFL
jgi:hypothetical protein